VADVLLWDAVRALLPDHARRATVDVLDLGGGTGGLAVPLAALGHRVTVVDSSPDALAALARRAGESGVEGQISARQGDADDLQVPDGAFDLVLCHGVLEHVDDPSHALAGIARALCPGGRLSLVVAQRSAAIVAAALSGHLARAQALLDDPEGRWGEQDPFTRRFDRAQIADLVSAAGLQVDEVHGLRILADLVSGVSGQLFEADPTAPSRLHDLDLGLAGQPEYAGLSASLHVLGTRRAERADGADGADRAEAAE
jgi:S-adenosylmethionine-dependent methyltransferase